MGFQIKDEDAIWDQLRKDFEEARKARESKPKDQVPYPLTGYSYSNYTLKGGYDYIRDEPLVPLNTNNAPKCECGAQYTRDPNLHSDWCPIYKKVLQMLVHWYKDPETRYKLIFSR